MKMKPIKTRKAWTTSEVHQLCSVYFFEFLQNEQRGINYQKAAPVRKLAESMGRSKGSIECKMMNISAVLQQTGKPYVKGYKPLSNYNRELFEQVAEFFVEIYQEVA